MAALLRIGALLVLLGAGILLSGGCSSARRLVFHPDPVLHANAADLHRPFEEVFLTTGDGVRLHGWFFPAAVNPSRPRQVILFCHGNAGNLSHRLPHFQILLETGASVFAFDYRGYGRSTGTPGELGTYLDAQVAYQWLRNKGFAPREIVAMGESLGGGVACELACRESLGGLILQSTFTSVPDVAAETVPWFPVRWFLGTHYNTHQKLPGVKIPVLILHSRGDRMIPFHHAERNYAAANQPKYFAELAGDHNETLIAGRERYREAVGKFLAQTGPK